MLSGNDRGHVEIAGYAQALENVNASRTAVWRTLHPFKNSAEKKNAEQMKAFLIEEVKGDEGDYAEIIEEAHKTFDGHRMVHARLAERTVHAREEETRLQKMTDARRESLRIEGFEPEPVRERSPRVEERTAPVREIKGLE